MTQTCLNQYASTPGNVEQGKFASMTVEIPTSPLDKKHKKAKVSFKCNKRQDAKFNLENISDEPQGDDTNIKTPEKHHRHH